MSGQGSGDRIYSLGVFRFRVQAFQCGEDSPAHYATAMLLGELWTLSGSAGAISHPQPTELVTSQHLSS